MKWTYRILGAIGGAACFFAGLTVGQTGSDRITEVRYVTPAHRPTLVTTTTLGPCLINGYPVKTGPGERKYLKCK